MSEGTVITILGSAGGVARAVLALLNRSAQDPNDPLHSIIKQGQLHLIDRKQKGVRYYRKLLPALKGKFVIHQFNLMNLPRLREHLRSTKTRLVVDLSWADTVEMLSCCNGLGIAYVNTALENRMIDENEPRYKGFPLIERVRILEKLRDDFTTTTAVICSGMNPGVVEWMALELMKKHPNETPLGCYVVEDDTSFFADRSLAEENTIYTTWAPACFLDEAILSYPMFANRGVPLFLHEPVYALEFKVRLGEKQFYGALMPHEEVVSLSRLLSLESGFFYRINEHTTQLIRSNMDHADDLWDHEMRVLDPAQTPLVGEDLVGVLLVFKDHEHYLYNVMSNQRIFTQYGVNATYFQVACGVYAGLSTLLLDEIPPGVHYVDELLMKTSSQYGKYLTYYMPDFVEGRNARSDGLLLDRMRKVDS